MSSLLLTIPATLLLAGALVALVVRAARRGEYDDWEGPAARMLYDDDSVPEREGRAAPHDEDARSRLRVARSVAHDSAQDSTRTKLTPGRDVEPLG